MFDLKTGAKLTHLFAHFQRFLADIIVEIIDFRAFGTEFTKQWSENVLKNGEKRYKRVKS